MSYQTNYGRLALYLPANVADEIASEARRQERSLSWLAQQAWMRARDTLRRIPSVPPVAGAGLRAGLAQPSRPAPCPPHGAARAALPLEHP